MHPIVVRRHREWLVDPDAKTDSLAAHRQRKSATLPLRLITPEHALYQDELELRFRVLREPLGQSRADVLFPFEHESLHLLLLEQERVVGCVLFHPESTTGGRLFQMAVATAAHGQGRGRMLVRGLEAELVQRGLLEVHLHARAQVVGFYERCGYACQGEPFLEVGIPHRLMRRTLR
jgi:ribosomal protein S18 acetylase RimI-like enzyme